MPWKLHLRWVIRWLCRQPAQWVCHTALLAGLFLSLALSPLRWIQPEAHAASQLMIWLPAWILCGFALSWLALAQIGPVLAGLTTGTQILVVGRTVLFVTLLTLLPLVVCTAFLAGPAQVVTLVTQAFLFLLSGLGLAVAVGILHSSYGARVGGLLAVLFTWIYLCTDIHPFAPRLFLFLPLAVGWVLLGVALKATQPQCL